MAHPAHAAFTKTKNNKTVKPYLLSVGHSCATFRESARRGGYVTKKEFCPSYVYIQRMYKGDFAR